MINYGFGKLDYDYGMFGEFEVYVDFSYKGMSSIVFGINFFLVSVDGILLIIVVLVMVVVKFYFGSVIYMLGVLISKGLFL